jgi:hypothetical protein
MKSYCRGDVINKKNMDTAGGVAPPNIGFAILRLLLGYAGLKKQRVHLAIWQI